MPLFLVAMPLWLVARIQTRKFNTTGSSGRSSLLQQNRLSEFNCKVKVLAKRAKKVDSIDRISDQELKRSFNPKSLKRHRRFPCGWSTSFQKQLKDPNLILKAE